AADAEPCARAADSGPHRRPPCDRAEAVGERPALQRAAGGLEQGAGREGLQAYVERRRLLPRPQPKGAEEPPGDLALTATQRFVRRDPPTLSFPRKRESRATAPSLAWTPAFRGVTSSNVTASSNPATLWRLPPRSRRRDQGEPGLRSRGTSRPAPRPSARRRG